MQQPTREDILLEMMAHDDYTPLKLKEIAILLQLDDKKKVELEESLNKLVTMGKVEKTKRGKFMLQTKPDVLLGKYFSHKKGFGFVQIEGQEDDIFIPGNYSNGAFHGDQVTVKLLANPRGKRAEGEIVSIISRGRDEIVGLYEKGENFGFVIPDDTRFSKHIFISQKDSKGAMTGHKVVVKMKSWGDEAKNPEGIITEIIGHILEPSTDILSIVKGMQIPSTFPDEVMSFVENISDKILESEMVGRLDIRSWPTVTIDGEDAKDLDDAITLSQNLDGTFKLGVHIADVTHYVTEGSPLDKEAVNRGTSVYLVDRVIPMLPQKLSNGICSLNAKTDRLALSCIMQIDKNGKVTSYELQKTVINVDERMTYTDVNTIIEGLDEEVTKRYIDFVPMFMLMRSLADCLRDKRRERGSIDFDFPEAKVKLNEQGEPIDIMAYERNAATKLIEDFMLLANETVAEHFFWQETPFVYRSHDEPDPERIKALGQFIYNFGYHIKGKEDIHPKEIQKLLYDIEGKKEAPLISRLALRSMKQARYTVSCDGHYGLSTKYYTHFTSPIRRYPDLQIHRIIKESIEGRLTEERLAHYAKLLPDIAKQSSETERRAEQAERETIKLKKVEYMSKFIGEVFEGAISGVTNWGLYVELPNTVEGLIHVTELNDDYYNYDEKKHMFIGERRGNIYTLGDTIRVEVLACNIQERTIDFCIHKEGEPTKTSLKAAKSKDATTSSATPKRSVGRPPAKGGSGRGKSDAPKKSGRAPYNSELKKMGQGRSKAKKK